MQRRYDPEQTILPDPNYASEHSVPFSDLRADTDTRHLRLWLANEIDDPTEWRSLDIARGGLTIVNKFEAVEHNNTRQNTSLLRDMSRAAFVLFEPAQPTDDDGNIIAFALPRNTSLQLGQRPRGTLKALRGSALAPNHVGLYVDDNDTLAIEAYDIDNMPQIEVVEADSDTAIHTGLADRDYVFPRPVGPGTVVLHEQPFIVDPLTTVLQAHAPYASKGIASTRTVVNSDRR